MSGGNILIHSRSTCQELRLVNCGEEERDEIDHGQTALQLPSRVVLAAPQRLPSRDMGHRSRSASRNLVRTASRDSERLSRLSSAAQMASVQSWLTQKARRAVVALPEDPELREVEKLCEDLLQKEQQLISELESTLCSHAREEACKREMLYHKWSRRVFAPLHSHITTIMGGRQYQDLDTEKRALFQRYLTHCNKKSVFLDTISADEYNGLTLQHTPLTAVTGVLKDPLLTQQTDRDTEQRIVSGNHSNDRSESRVAMDAVSWLAVQLIYVDSSVRERSRRRVKKDHNEMQGRKDGVGLLQLPHKTPLSHYHGHRPLSLTWPPSPLPDMATIPSP